MLINDLLKDYTRFSLRKGKMILLRSDIGGPALDRTFRLAQERENYLREKERNKQKLNQTYQYQIKHRIPELPKHYSDNEVSYHLNSTPI